MDGSGEGCEGEELARGMDEITRSSDKRDKRPGRDVDELDDDAVGEVEDEEDASGPEAGEKGCGELPESLLAANHAERVVWSTGHWSADPAGCCGGRAWSTLIPGEVDEDASALLLVNGHIVLTVCARYFTKADMQIQAAAKVGNLGSLSI